MSTINGIRIHPRGSGKFADSATAQKLSTAAPTGFRKAQDILLAAEKYAKKKGGFFSSERSRIQKLQSSLYELTDALKQDGFMTEEFKQKGEVHVLFEFFSQFSDAFPNWQREYKVLNHFIPLCF